MSFYVPATSNSTADIISLKNSRVVDEANIALNSSAITTIQGVNTTQTTNITANTTAITNMATSVTTNAVVSGGSSLALGGTSSTINIGTGAILNTLNLGTGSGVTTINVGGAGDTVNITGTTNIVNSTILTVTDPNIQLNTGGGVASGGNSGIKIQENGVVTGSILSRSARDGYVLQPCNLALPAINLNQSLLTTDNTAFNNLSIGGVAKFGGVRAIDLASSNVVIGKNCGVNVAVSSNNVTIGQDAFASASATSAAVSNVAVGATAMTSNISGSLNTAVGTSAMGSNTTGNNNTGIGFYAGGTNTTGSSNTFLGYSANPLTSALTNATAIGNGATVQTSNTMQLGNSSLALVNTNANLTCNQIIAGNTAITGTLSCTGNLSAVSTTFNINSHSQPVTVNGSFTGNTTAASATTIPIMLSSTCCAIKIRFTVTNSAATTYIAGIDNVGTVVTVQHPYEFTKIYNQAGTNTNNGYLSYSTGTSTANFSTIDISKTLGFNDVNFMKMQTCYTYSGVGSAHMDSFVWLPSYALVGILIYCSAGTVSGTYSVTNYF